jgi:RNA polymerase sigma-70 factor (ECF subfamily)
MRYDKAVSAMNVNQTEAALLDSLRAGAETAFMQLVEQYHSALVRLARLFVREQAVAEELAQETWLAVLQGIHNFEGRSSLKTWLFTILTNKAKTRGQRENRTISFTDLEPASPSPTVDPDRFGDGSTEARLHHWAKGAAPDSWSGVPEDRLLSQETTDLIRRTIESLPENQRTVITLRDVHELPSEEVCNVLGISETNQRVLLHRARAKVRQALEAYLKLETG